MYNAKDNCFDRFEKRHYNTKSGNAKKNNEDFRMFISVF